MVSSVWRSTLPGSSSQKAGQPQPLLNLKSDLKRGVPQPAQTVVVVVVFVYVFMCFWDFG